MIHELKTHPEPFADLWTGNKPFEIRRLDRAFKVDDFLVLRERDPDDVRFTGRFVVARITCISSGKWGLEKGYGVLGLADLDPRTIARETDHMHALELGRRRQ